MKIGLPAQPDFFVPGPHLLNKKVKFLLAVGIGSIFMEDVRHPGWLSARYRARWRTSRATPELYAGQV